MRSLNSVGLGLRGLLVVLIIVGATLVWTGSGFPETGTEFSGSVVMVDPAAGKLAVKKEGGGARFTFVANAKTRFEGAGLNDLKDIKKGDQVTVTYTVVGSQYLAQKVTRK